MKSREQEIEEAAKTHVREGDCELLETYRAHEDTFCAGVFWCESNPSPEVIGLYEAVKKECAKFNFPDEDRAELWEALAAFEARGKK